MTYPPVVIVNDNDEVVGAQPLRVAWERGLKHRIVFVVVKDDAGRYLLQRRAKNLELYPNRWDTVGGHVDITPDYEASARIELREECGIHDVALTEIGREYVEEPYANGVRARRFTKTYLVRYNGTPKTEAANEVSELRWFTQDEIRELSVNHPELIAECLHRCLSYMVKP